MSFRITVTHDGKLNSLVSDVLAKTMLDLHAGLVLATPVRDGRARAGWTVDPAAGVVENNVEYIETLNRGSSKQAPAGFVETEIDKAVNR